MRFKHTKIILLILINLLLVGLLYIGYQKIQKSRENKAYQDQFSKVTQLEGAVEKGKNVQIQEGIIGTSYVTAYYPTKDGQPVEIIKEKIQEDLNHLGSDEKTIVKKQQLLLSAIIPFRSSGLSISTEKENSSKMRR